MDQLIVATRQQSLFNNYLRSKHPPSIRFSFRETVSNCPEGGAVAESF